MSYCHVSNQLAWHAHQVTACTFGDYSQELQEIIISELAEAVLSDNASLEWVEYPFKITEDFARETALEEADFIYELANSVLHTQEARSLLISQIKSECKALIRFALETCGIAPEGYDFDALLLEDAA